jgi:hypothetical protein
VNFVTPNRAFLPRTETVPLNTSQLLFPHLVAAKRKRSEAVLDISNSDDLQPAKIRRIDTSRPEETAADGIAICEDGVQWAAGAAGARTPGKRRPSFSDVFSPNKRVQFNMKPMPPTPSRGGLAPRGILKTPLKATPHKGQERAGIGSPVLTPLKTAPCQLTPLRRSYDRKVLTVLDYLLLFRIRDF